MEVIKSITEAFSMQPVNLSVYTEQQKASYYDPETCAKEIKKEFAIIDSDRTEVYVGYNFEGKKIFQYLAKSVNVHFLP